MQANSWQHKLFLFICPFESGKCGKEEKKPPKIWISRERKELFRWNKKHFIVFEGLSFGENIKNWQKIVDTSFKLQDIQQIIKGVGFYGN